jgi:hypothetical protein
MEVEARMFGHSRHFIAADFNEGAREVRSATVASFVAEYACI